MNYIMSSSRKKSSSEVSGEKILNALLTIILQVKLYHWETFSYSRHKATDELFNKLLGKIDRFIEVYSGRYKRIDVNSMNIKIKRMSDKQMETMIKKYSRFLQKEIPKILSPDDTDLLAIRDEMLEEMNQSLYLFTLK